MDHKVPLSKVVLGMVRAAKGHKGPEWEEIAAVGCAVQVIIQIQQKELKKKHMQPQKRTRSSRLNCALRDAYWVSKGHYEAVAVGN